MDKEEFFSKLNIKDYNNELEKKLEKKSFSEGTKNILLNILYKIETSYEDYIKVKVGTKSKKEILEEVINIIEKNCNEIELVKPKLNEETKLKNKKLLIEKENKKIISYPNEKTVFYGLCNLSNNNIIINNKYEILKEPMEKLLNAGYIMEQEEIIRDFDGWTWNISPEEIENYVYNLVYQNIRILIGEKYLLENINRFPIIDFLDKFEKKIKNVCNEEVANKIIILIYQIAILEDIKENKSKREKLLKTKKNLEQELVKMENKKVYLQNLANQKKIIGREIKQIDEVINDNKLLRKEFVKQNEGLSDEEKVFSLSEYSELLIDKRKKLLQQLREYAMLMKPMNYVKMKSELKRKIEVLDKIDFKSNMKEQINKLIIELQKNFLIAINEKIEKIEAKKLIINYIYLFRYYKLLNVNRDRQIENIEELKDKLVTTEKHLITRGCNLKAINIICHNIEENYQIISKVLSSNIIDLEDIYLEFKKQGNEVLLNIYDDNIIDNTIEYEAKSDLNVKFNKKIKLFN